MRIKLKFWETAQKIWINPEYVALINGKLYFTGNADNGYYLNLADNLVAVEFIGKQDENQIDIYEGDICIIQDDEYNFAQSYDEEKDEYTDIVKCQIKWCEDAVAFIPYGLDGKHLFEEDWYWETITLKVIGNIYENPELLTPNPQTGNKN